MEPQWTPKFEDLSRNVLSASHSQSHDYVSGVCRELEANRASIYSVLETPPLNAGHRAQLKLGSPIIDGRVQTVNEQFIMDAILLSDQLEMDEYAAASLLRYGVQEMAKFDRSAVETAIILFHRERIALLHTIFSILDTSGTSDSPALFSRNIESFRVDLLSSGKGRLAEKALAMVERLDKKTTSLKNSISETSALVQQIGIAINEDRLDFIKQERAWLATILFTIGFYHEFSSVVLKSAISTLKNMNLSDPVTIHLTVAVMAALEISPEHMAIRGKMDDAAPAYMTEASFIPEYARLITDNTWAVPAIQSTILLQFCLCIGNAYNGRRDGLTEEELQSVAEKAVAADAFQFIANYILGFKSQVVINGKQFEVPFELSSASLGLVDQNADGFDTTIGKPVAAQMSTVMQDGVIGLLELSIRDLNISMLPLLRKIKHREEDMAFHHNSHRQSHPQTNSPAPRNDLQALFTVISLIYKGRPEAGIRFWPIDDDRQYKFLKLGVDCKNSARSYFDMLGSLATGAQCAHSAYEFLKSNGGRYGTQSSTAPATLCSWVKLFEAIEFYTSSLNVAIVDGGKVEKIRPEEEEVLKSFLRLLATVAQYSPVDRTAMNDSKQFRVVHALLRFFICPISVDLKACILDTIAAFATPSAVGSDSSSLVWEFMEQARILPKAYNAAQPEQPQISGEQAPITNNTARSENQNLDAGIGYDIDEIEAANEVYPETIAFTRLLSSLVQVPADPEDFISGGSPSIPAQLGSNYRQPGIIPYVRFILDRIFVKALNRSYRVANEKWKVIDACLSLMERCLLSFDIGSYILGDLYKKNQDHLSIEAQKNNAIRASLHPAFEILKRLLSGGDVLRELLRVLATGVDVLNKEDASTPCLKSSIVKAFRILTKTMQLQDVFMEYIVQVLLTTRNKDATLSSLAPIEEHLAYSNSSIVDIACFINCEVSNEICSLAIEVLDRLSASPVFTNGAASRGAAVNRLVRLLESSTRSNQVLYGFVQKMSTEDDEEASEFGAPQVDASMAIDRPGARGVAQLKLNLSGPGITGSTIRLQIMRLLLDNLDESRSIPSIAHFLLGFPTGSKNRGLEDVDMLASLTSMTTLHVILNLLRRGIDDQETELDCSESGPLYISHPQLAEKCHELVYRLCSEPQTTSPMMRYLRTREAFFYRNLRALPIRFEEGLAGNHGLLIRMDGSRFRGNFFHLISQMYQRSWVMRTAALELYAACDTKQRREALNLLSLLYSTTNNAWETNEDDFMYSISKSKDGNLVQPRMKILELLDSLDFSWNDDLKVKDMDRYYFADVSEDSCIVKDENGVEVLDVRKTQLESENMISGAGHNAAAHTEMEAILEQCVARNHARKFEFAHRAAFESWRELVEISLGPGFDLLNVAQREPMLYDLLEAVLSKIQGDCPVDVATILSKTALCVIQRLRSDHFRQFIFQATSTDPSEIDVRLPAERLQRVAQSIIDCILRAGNSPSRCNLYAILSNYFQYTRAEGDTHRSVRNTLSKQLHHSVNGHLSTRGRTNGEKDVREALELGNRVLVSEAGDRLLDVICKDASDVDQVCKIAAFTLLNTLYGLFEKEVTNRVLVHLVQRNYLKHFIEIMAREDLELQASVKGRVSRVPIVNETKMTLFLRIAQRRDGAEQLLEYGFFDVLTNASSVIDMRTNLDNSDYSPFEQTESNRYHNIVYPMLQVAVAVLANLGRNHRTATNKAELFVTNHQDTFAAILRDNDVPSTMNSLRELRAVTAFLNQLASHISTKASPAASVFGPLHSLMLALIPKYFSADQWRQNLKPISDAEKLLASIIAPALTAHTGMTLFERDSRDLSRDTCKNLISYCQISTDKSRGAAPQQFTPLFSWTISSVSGANDTAAVPSLATLVHYLDRTATEVQESLARHQEQMAKLGNITALTSDEKQDILEASDEDYIDELAPIQRDQLAVQVLQKMILASTQEVMSSLYLLETSLVLFWRHLEYYLGQYVGALDAPTGSTQFGLGSSRFGHSTLGNFGNPMSLGGSNGFRGSNTGFGASTSSAAFGSSTNQFQQSQLSKNFKPTLAEAQSLKRDAGHVIKPILNHVLTLELTHERFDWDNSARKSFIELLVRRIRALVDRN
ncbi:hypothetical protein BGW38_009637 [Lunasporangiospora selenospora]|uniref:Nucleoporin Nup186/Nup192/Nup205 n=1 Tax=Lunasporangiospora selenospora TaxID=979761 RepID=A0A9P6G253_9FUNG|nr:hypothetical protein BGW38_009637 [Lunasporangiospora selenospora]